MPSESAFRDELAHVQSALDQLEAGLAEDRRVLDQLAQQLPAGDPLAEYHFQWALWQADDA